MRGHYIIDKPVKLSDFTFDDLYVEISDNWEERAKRLQARRWHRLRRLAKEGRYSFSARGT